MKAWNVDASQTGNLLGLLTAKAQDIKVEDSDAYDNVVSVKKSTWLEYSED